MRSTPKPAAPSVFGPIVLAHPVEVDQSIALDASAQEQLAAREVNVKEAFTVVDSRNRHFRASRKSPSEALVYEAMPQSTESPLRVTLLVAVLGRQRMIPVLQKATELGCVRVVPVFSARSVSRAELEKEKPWAWPAQAIRASRQCRRAAVPEVLEVAPLAEVLASRWFAEAHTRLLLDDRTPDRDVLGETIAGPDLVLAAGPEGGWSDAERALFIKASALPLWLGPRVLRAETAVVAGLAVVQHRLGDLRGAREIAHM